MAEASRKANLPAFVSEDTRSSIYLVLAAYARAGLGYEQALSHIEKSYRARSLSIADTVLAVGDSLRREGLGQALLSQFFGVTPLEEALLASIPGMLTASSAGQIHPSSRDAVSMPALEDKRVKALTTGAILLEQAAWQASHSRSSGA